MEHDGLGGGGLVGVQEVLIGGEERLDNKESKEQMNCTLMMLLLKVHFFVSFSF